MTKFHIRPNPARQGSSTQGVTPSFSAIGTGTGTGTVGVGMGMSIGMGMGGGIIGSGSGSVAPSAPPLPTSAYNQY